MDHLIDSNKAMLEGQGIAVRNIAPDRNKFKDDAERRVALGLIMQAIIQKHDLKPDSDRLRQRVELMASEYDDSDAFISWYYSDRKRLAQLESLILEEQVIDQMLDSADVKEKKVTFDELMGNQGN